MSNQQNLSKSVHKPTQSKSDFTPALVIPTFSRDYSLKRLLTSLLAASYPNEVLLVISVDGGGGREVADLAERFEWPHGEKLVIHREKNLGLRQHLLVCGDMTEDYDSVIILEDDLYVSPFFYKFAQLALKYYSGEPEVAGIGLFSIRLHPWNRQPFIPSPDISDVFFVQAISPWGQVWSREKWGAFRSWLDTENNDKLDVQWLPKKLRRWGYNLDTLMYKYVVETDRYFVHPRAGLITNFCDAGAHYPKMNDFQVPLMMYEREVKLCKLVNSAAVYDAWLELEPHLLYHAHPALSDKAFTVDLFGTKDPGLVTTPYMLTVKPARDPIVSFALRMQPRDQNVLLNISGDDIVLARTEDVSRKESLFRIGYREHYYSYSHLKIYQMVTAIIAKAYTRAWRMIATRQFR